MLNKLASLIAGKSASQVQADWGQNDSTQPDYIKGRLCYEVETVVDIIPEQTVTVMDGKIYVENVDETHCTDGQNVTLCINQETIEGVIQYHYIGFYYGTFGCFEYSGGAITVGEAATVSDGDSVTVRMYGNARIVYPLDAKYIPANVPKLGSVNVYDGVVMVGSLDENNVPTSFHAISLGEQITNRYIELSAPMTEQQVTSTKDEKLVFEGLNITSEFGIELQSASANNVIVGAETTMNIVLKSNTNEYGCIRIPNLITGIVSDYFITGKLIADNGGYRVWKIDICSPNGVHPTPVIRISGDIELIEIYGQTKFQAGGVLFYK